LHENANKSDEKGKTISKNVSTASLSPLDRMIEHHRKEILALHTELRSKYSTFKKNTNNCAKCM